MTYYGLGKVFDQAKFEDALNAAQADGRMSTGDADEVRNFADFLEAAGPAPGKEGYNRQRYLAALEKHYPDRYRDVMAAAEKRDRR